MSDVRRCCATDGCPTMVWVSKSKHCGPFREVRRRNVQAAYRAVCKGGRPLPDAKEREKKWIEYRLAQLDAKRRRPKFDVGSAGGRNTAGNHAHGENVREPSTPIRRLA